MSANSLVPEPPRPLTGAQLMVEPVKKGKQHLVKPLLVEPLITTKPNMVTKHDMSFSTAMLTVGVGSSKI